MALYFLLPLDAMLVLPIWGIAGLVVYFGYSRSHSHVGRGLVEVHEIDSEVPHAALAGLPGTPAPGDPEE